ncbi:MAG: hypothetical protein ACXWC6_00420 [Ramlibacter sp.]
MSERRMLPYGPARDTGDEKTEVRADGLRYVSKSQGTDFPGAFAATMSCFVCGKHVARSSLQGFRVAGSMQFRCRTRCN